MQPPTKAADRSASSVPSRVPTQWTQWALAMAICAGLTGCASSPERTADPRIEIPENWTTQAGIRSQPEAWLKDFDDPELESLIEEALRQNADLERASAVLAQSIAEARIAGADLMPSANLGLAGSRQQISTFGPTATGGVIFENYDLSLDLSWEVDLWGRLRDQSSAALARVELSQAELYAARLSLAAQVSKAWFNLKSAQEQLVASIQTAESYRENLKTLEARFRRGLAEGIDLRRIRTLAASAESDVALRRRSVDSAQRQLESLLGRYPSGSLSSQGKLPTLPAAIPTGLPAQLLERRPDLIAAERQVASAEKELSADRKALLPKISLTGSGGTSSDAFEDLIDSDFQIWALAGNLTQPIFQGGRIRANIDRSASIRDQALANYRNVAILAFLEVETTLAAEAYLKDEYELLELASAEADATEISAWERYSNGTADFLEVLDAQRTAASNRSRVISARNNLLQNRIDLYLALGGPFDPES